MNLLAFAIDEAGAVGGEAAYFADSDEPLPVGARSGIPLIHLHPGGRRLYLATAVDFPGLRPPPPSASRRALTVYDLDRSGRPVGAPRSYDAGNRYGSLLGMAKHPSLDLLYLSGWGEPAVVVYSLDAAGEPVSSRTFPLGAYGKSEVAVSRDGTRLYLGTYPDRLEVVQLDGDGSPVGPVEAFSAGFEPGAATAGYLRFRYTSSALYRRSRFEQMGLPDAPLWPLVVWPLDGGSGMPVGSPTVDAATTARAIAVDEERHRLWACGDATFREAVSGRPRRCGAVAASVSLDAAPGAGGPAEPVGTSFRQRALVAAVSASGVPVVLSASAAPDSGDQVRGHRVRVTPLEIDPPQQGRVLVWLAAVVGGPVRQQQVASGSSALLDLDPVLTGKAGDVLVRVGVGPFVTMAPTQPPAIKRLTVRLDVYEGDPDAGATLLRTMTETVAGSAVSFLAAGYGFVEPGARASRIETTSERAQRHLARARSVALAEDERPRSFVVSAHQLLGGQAHLGQLRDGAATLGALGINTVMAYLWGPLPPETVNAELDRHGLSRRAQGTYHPLQGQQRPDGGLHAMPLSYFDFYIRRHPRDLEAWAAAQVKWAADTHGGAPETLAHFALSDEPGWYYPGVVREILANPDYLEDFRAYLDARDLTPEFFEVDSWDEVTPVSSPLSSGLGDRRRHYWTARFFADAATGGHELVTAALESAFGHQLAVGVNWNNWISAWYQASPNHPIANNPDVGPESALGSFDWFRSGRLGAHTSWTEDWIIDRHAQRLATYADALRSAAAQGDRPEIGSYVVGHTLRAHAVGASYKVLSLVGRGAKTISFYTFGPNAIFPDGWSERFDAYGSIADAMRLLGRAEGLLHPARPRRGSVAVLLPSTSHLWNDHPLPKLFADEVVAIHYALVHAGYNVDFVDDEDLGSRDLHERGYRTIYVTGPNVSAAALGGLARWVQRGGVLAVTPGAAVADEYNTPSPALDEVLGLRPRQADRTRRDQPAYFDDAVTPTDSLFGGQTIPLRGPFTTLQPAGDGGAALAVAGTFRDGRPAITVNRHGGGTAIAYAFYPGRQYWWTPHDPLFNPFPRDPRRLPSGWGADERRLVVAPALARGVSPHAVPDHELVECCVLDAPAGVAVVLLNWSGEPIESLSLTVPSIQRPVDASSARGEPVVTNATRAGLVVRLPLEHTDVLMLRYRDPGSGGGPPPGGEPGGPPAGGEPGGRPPGGDPSFSPCRHCDCPQFVRAPHGSNCARDTCGHHFDDHAFI